MLTYWRHTHRINILTHFAPLSTCCAHGRLAHASRLAYRIITCFCAGALALTVARGKNRWRGVTACWRPHLHTAARAVAKIIKAYAREKRRTRLSGDARHGRRTSGAREHSSLSYRAYRLSLNSIAALPSYAHQAALRARSSCLVHGGASGTWLRWPRAVASSWHAHALSAAARRCAPRLSLADASSGAHVRALRICLARHCGCLTRLHLGEAAFGLSFSTRRRRDVAGVTLARRDAACFVIKKEAAPQTSRSRQA